MQYKNFMWIERRHCDGPNLWKYLSLSIEFPLLEVYSPQQNVSSDLWGICWFWKSTQFLNPVQWNGDTLFLNYNSDSKKNNFDKILTKAWWLI